jgi:hypothetical protein
LAITKLALETTFSNRLPVLPGNGCEFLGDTGCLGMDIPVSCFQNRDVVAAKSDKSRNIKNYGRTILFAHNSPILE